MGKTKIVEHEIDVQGSGPLKRKPYSLSKRDMIDKQINEMLEHNII